MLNNLEKHWTITSVSLFLILLVAVLFWPTRAKALSLVLLIASLSITALSISYKQLRAYREGLIGHFAIFFRNISVEIAGILLSIGFAAFLAERAAYLISTLGIVKWEDVVFTLLVAVLAGLVTSWSITMILDWLVRPRARQ